MRAMGREVEVKHFSAPLRRFSLTILFSVLLVFSCFGDLRCGAKKLAKEEVEALKVIASKLRKDWNFSVDPCSGDAAWQDPTSNKDVASNLTCDCNATSGVCHVTSILLKSQNLTGYLPEEFANLSFLSVLDLSRNYLNGSIPKTWASLPLAHLAVLGNRVSGRIPKELGGIRTLQNLTLEDNQLQGPIPAALGNLASLSRLHLSANNLSGDLQDSLGKLKNLEDFRIDGNPITGKIPSFIGNWTNLQRLDMQGTSMEGPFPSIFSTLKSITELRVSDLKGGDGKFPPLQNMKNMKELVLRNLSISGQLPVFIGDMSKLKVLDLSFNSLTGPIPGSFDGLAKSIDYMYLTSNKLDGAIPVWILNSRKNLDVSYNSFTESPPANCWLGNVNLVSSFSSTNINSIASCLRRNLPCSGKAKNYNLFINCGGSHVTVDGNEYEDDTSPQGASRSVESESRKWAYSSTGDFVGNGDAQYIARNASMLNMTDPELYMTARLNPLSLKYYGLCLQKGQYTVKLHFAEIMFTDDQTYFSVGERFFDVSIQGQKVLQDFNIAKEARGTGKKIIKVFNASVDGTLEIHFQWLGKGTNAIPQRGVYGPLISAISVTPNFKPDTGESKLSVGAIFGIVAASCVVIMLIITLLWICIRRKKTENSELRGLELQTGYFTLKQIKTATKNFDPENKIGEGGFGSVYRGVLPDGSEIAVKQLSSKSKQGNREFINEIGMISALQHPNLVKLYGCCMEGNQLLLIYEYMENNSLARALFGPQEHRLKLDWRTRRKICLGIARGLAFLHEESRIKIVHRDIKGTNILLDKDLDAKISDFGLARLDEEENTHISTRIAGTIGYMAPEYAMRGYLTDKADVYSFGVVTLEIVSGMSNTNYRPKEDFVYLLDWAYVLQEQGSLLELVDTNLGSNYSKEEALQMLNLALVCTNPSPTLRPTMSTVVSMLDGKTPVRVPEVMRSISKTEDLRFKSFEKMSNASQSHSISADGPWIDSSISAQSSKGSPSHSSTSKLLSDHTE
ncbi:probable LRR receptor-like serine/threonine-protein kinase At1g53430 [Phoenix dactylifera]|uniref:non-specific serine/threonine protein kinase n=1 Tax=Phoenix dactylifera TaxID=42345 RepID=A0A8B7C5P5_PHODC|nr:probable LRR receptor-like serine/threonine-protein kinase At1g53430 [Phoenix dactylifera]